MTLAGAVAAATLVLFQGDNPAEHLFVVRAETMRFAGGAVVFPGGRVDPGDVALAERYAAYDCDDAAARIAAIRETIEETGLAVGVLGALDIPAVRAALAEGVSFADLLDAGGATLALDRLVPFARWCPNPSHHNRTFDTRFYLARAPAGVATVDATENVDLFWASAADVLTRADADDVRIIFPTRRNLERLAGLSDYQAAVAHAARHPVATITPWTEDGIHGQMLCIPRGHGYPVTEEALATAFRL